MRKPKVNKNVESFTKETTFHGVKYVFDGEARLLRRSVCDYSFYSTS